MTAPAELRERLDGLSTTRLVRQAVTLEPGEPATPMTAAMLALRSLVVRYQHLDAEIQLLTRELDRLTASHAPALRALLGVGPEVAVALLVCRGQPRPTGFEAALRRCAAPPRWRLGQDPPASAEPGRGPPSQRRPAPDRCGCVGTSPLATTSSGAPPKARPRKRSCGASLVDYPQGLCGAGRAPR